MLLPTNVLKTFLAVDITVYFSLSLIFGIGCIYKPVKETHDEFGE